MKEKEFKIDLQMFAEGDAPEAIDVELLKKQIETSMKAEFDKKLAEEKIARENAEQKAKTLELDKMDEKSKADFLAKEKEENLMKRIAEAEAKAKDYEDKAKSFESKIKDVELKENIIKLKTQYPLLTEDLDSVKSWEGLTTFLEMKNNLQKRAEELAKYKEIVRKSGGSAFDESGNVTATDKEKQQAFIAEQTKLAKAKLLAR